MGRTSRFAAAGALSIVPVIVGSRFGAPVTTAVGSAVSLFWISALAAVDKMWRRLPDALVALAVLPIAMVAAVSTLQGSTTAVLGSGYGAALWSLPLLVAHVVAPAGVGFGDVKAGGVVGALVGLTQSVVLAGAGLVLALAAAVGTAWWTRRDDIALGPFLAGAAVVCLAAGPSLERW